MACEWLDDGDCSHSVGRSIIAEAENSHSELAMSAAHRLLAMSLVLVGLAACGGGEEREAEKPMAVEDTVFGDMVGTQDKARAVQDTTMEHKQEMDRALDDAEK